MHRRYLQWCVPALLLVLLALTWSAPPTWWWHLAGTIALAAGTSPPGSTPDALLVERGKRLFFQETFEGNGRTCATCHRAERHFTIDPAFIATLPATDPLFVAETQAALAKLEDRA
ncbi:MAG: hypothetical protein FJZ47_24075 [Candidatus Tectomicrobia bacterium]|uniref:Cytochrome c domain-containing protein n=1 Tax=Tectimicrobiota bacterium TaxID=2528274 RepID=A0A937W804_UNCTE|nr:hypothetical protein [Candidatus Tectomicrobia bacterium]